jgi:hypothetical protein
MEISRDLIERPGLTESLETLAAVAGRQGDPRTGALLIGAADALRRGRRDAPARRGGWVPRIVAEPARGARREATRPRGRGRGSSSPTRRRVAGAQRTLMSRACPLLVVRSEQ